MSYFVRKLYLLNNQKELCDSLSQESGTLYSQTVKLFWRTVRKKNLWLKPKHLMRLFTSNKVHAHTADASVQMFFNALNSWKEVRKTVPTAKPPHKLHKYCAVVWKNSAIRLKNNKLILSNGKITDSLEVDWEFKEIPVQVTMRWTGNQYEIVCCYKEQNSTQYIEKEELVSVDIGQIHVGATSEGTLLNGRLLRAIRQGAERSESILNKRISGRKKGSNRRKKLIEAKRKMLRKTKNKVSDILHKYTTGLVMYLKQWYNTLVVGDLTGYRVEKNSGSKLNQENHAWLYSRISFYLKYKWKRLGLKFEQIEESYTSQTCLCCGEKNKPKGRNYKCKSCGFECHRDVVGAINILRKYLGTFGKKFQVDAVMIPATHGVRYSSQMSVAHGFKNL